MRMQYDRFARKNAQVNKANHEHAAAEQQHVGRCCDTLSRHEGASV
jgi:hypothetical protein